MLPARIKKICTPITCTFCFVYWQVGVLFIRAENIKQIHPGQYSCLKVNASVNLMTWLAEITQNTNLTSKIPYIDHVDPLLNTPVLIQGILTWSGLFYQMDQFAFEVLGSIGGSYLRKNQLCCYTLVWDQQDWSSIFYSLSPMLSC